MLTGNLFKRIALTITFSFLVYSSLAQKNYLPGYIIRPGGDTLKGFLDYRNWERNPKKIFFKEYQEGEKSGYTPTDIKGFGVLDEVYESGIVETEVGSDKTNDLGYDPVLAIEIDTCFLQAVVKGSKSLYYYQNRLGREQFYIKQDTSFELLVYKKYLKDQGGHSFTVENNRYLGQLTIYLGDCPALQKKLQSVNYQKNSLENLFLLYYDCTSSEMRFHKKTENPVVAFGVLAGVSLTSLTFRSAYFTYLVDAGYPPSFNFSGGLFADVVFSRNQGRWSICNELIFTSYKTSGRFDEFYHENKYNIYTTTFGYSYLKLNNLVRLKYPIGKFSVYANVGISNGFAIAETNYMKIESKFYSIEHVDETKALDETRRYELGFLFGLGGKFKRYSCELRYEYGNGMSVFTFLNSTTHRIYLFLGFRF